MSYDIHDEIEMMSRPQLEREYLEAEAELTRYIDFMKLTLKSNDCYCDAIPWDLDMSKPKCVVCQIYHFMEDKEDEG